MSTTDVGLAALDDETAMQLLGETDAPIADPELVSKAIVSRILTAADVDAVFDTGAVTPAKEMLGKPIKVLDLRFNRSSFEDGASVYAIIEAVDTETGEQVTMSCGARNVMAQLYRLKQLGKLDGQDVKIIEAGETAQGYRPMWLARV